MILRCVCPGIFLGVFLLVGGCNSGSDGGKPHSKDESGEVDSGDDSETEGETAGESGGSDGDLSDGDVSIPEGSVGVTGSLALGMATHVLASNSEFGSPILAEIDENGAFVVTLEKSKPYTLSFIDSSKSGSAMQVGHFKSESLDTISSVNSLPGQLMILGALDQGTALTAGPVEFTSEKSHTDLIEEMGLDTESAAFVGSIDNVLKRYLNPDIDNNGVIDAAEGVSFILDFHNGFMVKIGENRATLADIKNKFLPNTVSFDFEGTGIGLETEKDYFGDSVPTNYTYTFDSPVVIDGTTIPAGTPIARTYTPNPHYHRYQIDISVDLPPEGTYVIEVLDKTFTFTGVEISDLSAGEGFLLPFVKINVKSDETIEGIAWRWMKLNDQGVWVKASQVEVDLVATDSCGLDLKVDGVDSGKAVAFACGKTVEGTTSIEQAQSDDMSAAEIKSLTFDRVLENPGLSYDNKMGMRFFQSFEYNSP